MERELAFEYSENPFGITFQQKTREPKTWKEEIRAIAREIPNAAGKRPIFVCSSGGIDSELVCRALFEEGIHFSVLTVEHEAGTNEDDIQFARKWCREHGIAQKVVRLDMPEFFTQTIERFTNEGYYSGNVFRYFQLFLLETIESLGGYAVLGGGEQLYEIDTIEPKERDVYLEFESGITVPLEWMKRQGSIHRPYFYFSTSEACLAYLRIPIVDFAVRHPEVFRHQANKYIFKRFVCQSLWPDIVPRQKLSGYEEIYNLRMETQKRLRDRFADKIQTYRLPVVEFRRELEGIK